MHRPKYIISIPQPCHEKWEEMTPVEQGRFCAQCQKKVIDFSGLNDEQVVRVLENYKEQPLCGRYDIWQLNRAIKNEATEGNFGVSFLKKIAASLFMIYSGISNGWAQERVPQTHQGQEKPNGRPKNHNGEKGLGGYVADVVTGRQLRGIEMYVAGTDFKNITDANGYFHIDLPDTFIGRPLVLAGRITPQADSLPAGSSVLELHISEIKATGNFVYTYMYPEDGLDEVIVAGRKRNNTLSGISVVNVVRSEEVPKKRGAFRNWFRKKHKHHD